MVTIPVQLSNELASRVLPLQERLPEIIELDREKLSVAAPQSLLQRGSDAGHRGAGSPRAISVTCLPPNAGAKRPDTRFWRVGRRPVT